MKFVCDRCQTKYSIADEKVRGKILKVRCKSCSNVITVREAPTAVPAHAEPSEFEDSARTVVASVPDHLAAMNAAAAPRRSSAAMPTIGSTGAPHAPPAPPDDVQWFLALEGVQKGPFSRKGVVDKLFALPRDADVHVWNEKMDGWKPPKDVPVIERELQARRRPGSAPPPPPGRPRSGTGPQPAQAAAAARTTKSHPLPGPHGTAAGSHAAGHEPASTGEHGPHRAHHPANGVAVHASAAGGTPEVLLSGESDALNALNLKQNDVAGSGVPWQASAVPSISTTSAISSPSQLLRLPRQRNTKLILAFLCIVGVIVIVVTFNLMKKPAAVTADKPKTATPEENFKALSDKIEQEKKIGQEPPAVVAQPEPSTSIKVEPTKTTVATVKPTKPGRRPARGGRASAAAARGGRAGASAAPGTGAADDPSLSRFSDISGRPLNLQPGVGGGARGTPAQADITRVISNNKAGIKICYQRALLRDSSLTHGKINVRVSIGLSGRAKSVNVDGPLPFRALEPCIREVLSRWAFPPSSEEYGTEFSYVFQGNE